jgi:hypothetical protein
MTEAEDTSSPVAVKITWSDYSHKNLAVRVEELKARDAPLALSQDIRIIQFLRGVASRAGFVLPAFYTFAGASAIAQEPSIPYSRRVQASAAEQSALATIALACRAIFDASSGQLSAKYLVKASGSDLTQVARYWADSCGRTEVEAMKALELLREVFARCALSRRALLDKPSLLERRVGLLKYYTDRQVAHITLEPFLFGLADAIHVVAAMAIIGAIIIEFDDHSRGRYFDIIDEAAWDSAKALYPSLVTPRLFDRIDLHGQARNCWKIDAFDGIHWILNQLPAAIGHWDSEDDEARDSHVGP